MRTTVTIDSDTEHLLREEAARTGSSFKEVLNQSIRRALAKPSTERVRVEPVFDRPFPVEFEEISMNRLADEFDDAETIRELSR
ncbi:MAG: antitoxin [Verrucomicrobiota bacterium]